MTWISHEAMSFPTPGRSGPSVRPSCARNRSRYNPFVESQLASRNQLAKREHLKTFQVLSPEIQGQIPAWTVLYVPCLPTPGRSGQSALPAKRELFATFYSRMLKYTR